MNPVYIIAEAGVNHNGSMETAKALIDVAVQAGADAVKFQSFRADALVSKTAAKAEYQKRLTDAQESQYEMLKKLELSEQDHDFLKNYCEQRNIQFLSTPFDHSSLDLLVRLGVPRLKISSGDLTNAPFLLAAARTGLPLILSTGMGQLHEIRDALAVVAFGYLSPDRTPDLHALKELAHSQTLTDLLKDKVSILQCTTEYPTPYSDVHLLVMDTLAEQFGLEVGLSDHTNGIAVPIAAVARGAKIIEKHFTLDKHLPGPDHQASLEPAELLQMIQSIRQVELALGNPEKTLSTAEHANKQVARKSLVASRPIRGGERFSPENLTIKRPGTGIAPIQYWDWLGREATRDFAEDEVITADERTEEDPE